MEILLEAPVMKARARDFEAESKQLNQSMQYSVQNDDFSKHPASSSDMNGTLEHRISNRILFVTSKSDRMYDRATRLVQLNLNQIVGDRPYSLIDLQTMLRFMRSTKAMFRQTAEDVSVAVACNHEPGSIGTALLLLGAYMILQLGFDAEQVELNFRPVLRQLESQSEPAGDVSRLRDGLAGLHRAHRLGWLAAAEDRLAGGPREAQVAEFVPSKLLAIDSLSVAALPGIAAPKVRAVIRLVVDAGAGARSDKDDLAARGIAVRPRSGRYRAPSTHPPRNPDRMQPLFVSPPFR